MGIFILLLAVFILCGLYNPLSVSKEEVASGLDGHPVRIVLVTDLHSCRYGENESDLIDTIDRLDPDLVCLVGDIFDDTLPDDNTECFLAGISDRYPCYYVTGNHECRSKKRAFLEKMEKLAQYGITRLENESREIELYGRKIRICGVDDPGYDAYDRKYRIEKALEGLKKDPADSAYTILLSHRPQYFPQYAGCGFDLVLCGHAHGGQWRIPWILENGLYAPGEGIFPKYTTGKHVRGNTTMVVSRGLAKESTRVPRFYNRPEVVLVEIT